MSHRRHSKRYSSELDDINNSVINSIIRLRSTFDYISLNRITYNNRIFISQLLEAYSNLSYDDLEDVKVTMNDNEFSKLKSIENYQETEQTCSICLDTLKHNCVTELKCEHAFHKDCIKLWLTKQSIKCPVCRMPQKDT